MPVPRVAVTKANFGPGTVVSPIRPRNAPCLGCKRCTGRERPRTGLAGRTRLGSMVLLSASSKSKRGGWRLVCPLWLLWFAKKTKWCLSQTTYVHSPMLRHMPGAMKMPSPAPSSRDSNPPTEFAFAIGAAVGVLARVTGRPPRRKGVVGNPQASACSE